MYAGKITALRDNGSSVDIMISVADDSLAAVIKNKKAKNVLLRLTDGRRITLDQRKKIYATLKDISNHTGYLPEEAKQIMKYVYIEKTASEYFSLADCSVETARAFINVLTDFCLEYGVITADTLAERADGTREMVFCHCHPLVRNGKIKAWEGDSALRRLKRKKKGRL